MRIDARSIKEKRDDFLVRSCPSVHAAMYACARIVPVGHARMHRNGDLLAGMQSQGPEGDLEFTTRN